MYLGIDFGTSGCRAIVIDQHNQVIAQARQGLPSPQQQQQKITQQVEVWITGLRALFEQLTKQIDLKSIKRLAIDGTSATVLTCDLSGQPFAPALMYNDSSSKDALSLIRRNCPTPEHLCMNASSGLAKAIQLTRHNPDTQQKILNQADYLSNYLCNRWGFSDQHNALKLGFDIKQDCWPEWISKLLPDNALPKVQIPGKVIAEVNPDIAAELGLSKHCQICSGTTDANAAFIATGCIQAGDAVTSLGSTLVLKILNTSQTEDLATGVYSHKLGQYWLCGGASNAGAGILRQFFSDQQLTEISKTINFHCASGLDYYPLSSQGERFPILDPNKQPRIEPRPESDSVFLQALLEGLSNIERMGYKKLTQLGAIQPQKILTTGGGATNIHWQKLRSKLLGIPVSQASQTEAAYGSAMLAHEGLARYL